MVAPFSDMSHCTLFFDSTTAPSRLRTALYCDDVLLPITAHKFGDIFEVVAKASNKIHRVYSSAQLLRPQQAAAAAAAARDTNRGMIGEEIERRNCNVLNDLGSLNRQRRTAESWGREDCKERQTQLEHGYEFQRYITEG